MSRQRDAEAAVNTADRNATAARLQIPHYPWVKEFEPVLPNDNAVAVAIATPPAEKPVKPVKTHTDHPAKHPDPEKPVDPPADPVANNNPPPVVAPADP